MNLENDYTAFCGIRQGGNYHEKKAKRGGIFRWDVVEWEKRMKIVEPGWKFEGFGGDRGIFLERMRCIYVPCDYQSGFAVREGA